MSLLSSDVSDSDIEDSEPHGPRQPAMDTFALYQGPRSTWISTVKNTIETTKYEGLRYDELLETLGNDTTLPESVTRKEWYGVRRACRKLASAIEDLHGKCLMHSESENDEPLDKEWGELLLRIVRQALQLQRTDVIQRVDSKRGENWCRGGKWSVRFEEIARTFSGGIPLFVNIPVSTWEPEHAEDTASIVFSGFMSARIDVTPAGSQNHETHTSVSTRPTQLEHQPSTIGDISLPVATPQAIASKIVDRKMNSAEWNIDLESEARSLVDIFDFIAQGYGPDHPEWDPTPSCQELIKNTGQTLRALSAAIRNIEAMNSWIFS